MPPIFAGLIARVLLAALAGALTKLGYDAAEQRQVADALAAVLGALVAAGVSTVWGVISRKRSVSRAVEVAKTATLAQPELTRAEKALPEAKGKVVIAAAGKVALADPLTQRPAPQPRVTVAKLNELIAAERRRRE